MSQYLHGCYGPKKWTVLEAAVSSGNIKLLKLLLQHSEENNAEVLNKGMLLIATESNQPNMLKFLLKTLPKLNNEIEACSHILLVLAISKGSLKCTKIFIDFGADLNTVDEDHSNSILHHAVLNEQYGIVKYLLENYVTVRDMIDDLNDSDDEPIDYAIGKQNWKMAELLIKNGAGTSKGHENILATIYTYKHLNHLDIVALNLGATPSFMWEGGKELVITRLLYAKSDSFDSRTNEFPLLIHTECKKHLQRLLEKLAVLIQHGFDTSLMNLVYKSDENHTFLTLLMKMAFSYFHNARFIKYRNSLLGLLYESGYNFKYETPQKCADLAKVDSQAISIMESMKCVPLSLQKLAGNVIRVNLKPNSSAIHTLNVPTPLKDIILMRGHPWQDYPTAWLHI